MKIRSCLIIIVVCFSNVASCAQPTQYTIQTNQHTDSFYDVNDKDYPLLHLPLIKPIEAKRQDGLSPWRVLLNDGPYIKIPNRQDIFYYDYSIEALSKFAISNGVIMAYSPYVDKNADPYVLDNYYHWFVLVPDKNIAEGFHTKDEFRRYIQSFGIKDLDWQTPDEAYRQFENTGCLEWIPDCK